MSDNEVNIPLLRKAVEWAETEATLGRDNRGRPLGHWYQGEWVLDWNRFLEESMQPATCGTTYCIAGYVGQLLNEQLRTSQWLTKPMPDGGFQSIHVSEFAQEALGLTDEQANRLFRGSNSVEDVRRIAEEIAGERL